MRVRWRTSALLNKLALRLKVDCMLYLPASTDPPPDLILTSSTTISSRLANGRRSVFRMMNVISSSSIPTLLIRDVPIIAPDILGPNHPNTILCRCIHRPSDHSSVVVNCAIESSGQVHSMVLLKSGFTVSNTKESAHLVTGLCRYLVHGFDPLT